MTKKNPKKHLKQKQYDSLQKEMRNYYGHLLPEGAIRVGRIKLCNNHNKKNLYQQKVNALMPVQPCKEIT